jgi:hypothetical protein
MTLNLIAAMTETRGRPNKGCVAQGLANVTAGAFGTMGGCAMIGQSMMNIGAGTRHRLSGVTAALRLLAFVLVGVPVIKRIPLATLVGAMLMVVVGTFEWATFKMRGSQARQRGLDRAGRGGVVSAATDFTTRTPGRAGDAFRTLGRRPRRGSRNRPDLGRDSATRERGQRPPGRRAAGRAGDDPAAAGRDGGAGVRRAGVRAGRPDPRDVPAAR